MLASPNVMMADARRHGYAIPAFNYYNTARWSTAAWCSR